MSRDADQAAEHRAGTTLSSPGRPEQRASAAGQEAGARPVHLVFASSPVEQDEVARWLSGAGEAGTIVNAADPDLALKLASEAGDPLVTPVGVIWLPPERGGVRRASVVDLLTLGNPRRPSARTQRRILRRDP